MRAAIVLAAGKSRRFGTANKLFARVNGRSLLSHAIHAALREPVGRIIVMTGPDRQRIAAEARAVGKGRVIIRTAKDHGLGHRHSLANGLQMLTRHETEALVFLADAPGGGQPLMTRLSRASKGKGAARAVHGKQPGHPVLIRDVASVIEQIQAGNAPLSRIPTGRVVVSRSAVADIDRPIDRRRFAAMGAS